METHETSPPPPRRIDAYTRWCIASISLCLILLSVYAAMIGSLRSRIDAEIERIRKEGSPINTVEPAMPTTWPADDAAEDYKAAAIEFESLKLSKDDLDILYQSRVETTLHPDPRWPGFAPEQVRRRGELANLLGPLMSIYQRAGLKSEYRKLALCDLDEDARVSTRFYRGFDPIDFIEARAVVAITQPAPLAYFQVLDALLVRSNFEGRGSRPNFQAGREVMIGQAFTLVKEGFCRLRFTEQELACLAGRLDDGSRGIDLSRSAKLMRAWMIERFGNGPKPLILGFHIRWFRVYEAQELLRDTAYHFLGGIEADRLSVLRRMREEVRICALPPDQRKQAVEDFAAQDAHVPWYCAQASTLGNNLLGCFGGIDCCDMQIELMRTAIAIERYRLANADRLPETIGDLIPRYLARIPVTPMTCEQAVYTPGKNDYVVRIGRAAPAPGLGPGPGPGVWSFQELKVDFPAK